MAEGRTEDSLQADGRRTGVWVALDPNAAACGGSTGQLSPSALEPKGFLCAVLPLLRPDLLSELCGSQHGDLCTWLPCLVQITYITYITWGIKYKYIQIKVCSYCQHGIKLYFLWYVCTHMPQMHTRSFHKLELLSFYALKNRLMKVPLL